ncbi:MAG TPA: extracellular solute-binding protein [Candidatus Limnocylindrales bacterium]|nr:extracellular solute-binding protein [Candidatus Limnocylindrales bacterium]
MTVLNRRSLLSLAGASAASMLLPGCSGGGNSGSGTQTVNWWHISNQDPMLTVWASLAKEYESTHLGVKINITPLENEAFKAKLTTVTQAGNPPDIFHSWGGGVLKQQKDAGLVKDITSDTSSWIGTLLPASVGPYQVDGKQYGLPFDLGLVGFWYNKDLFTKAGIAAPPSTWDDFLNAVGRLKASGVAPLALAGADKWPGHYYWAYLAMRVAGLDGLKQAAIDKSFDKPEFVQAGRLLKELVGLQPFQKGFLGVKYDTPDGQAATVGNGTAAMELMGQWAPSVQKSSSNSKTGLGDKLGFFTFPSVKDGKGKATDAFGGGNGFAIGRNAPPAAIDFVKFLLSVENQQKAAVTDSIVPITKGAETALQDPNLKAVSKALGAATGYQLYLDQAYPPAVGQQVNDSVAELIAGKASPEQVTSAITKVAKSQ